VRILLHVLFLSAAWKWGDWRNWRQYYPTMLYMIVGDLMYNFLTYNYTMWKFNPTSFDKGIYSSHTLITLGIDFINFPAVVLLYITHFPAKGLHKQILYILVWAMMNSLIELAAHFFSGISYEHGWNYGWSALFNVIMYILLRTHYKQPLLALGLSAILIVSYCFYFKLPLNTMK